ncbi:MAG TPA: hypothetical protein IGS40_15875 [Trichormus sp. M33_DOE_039]|nr:hypothetical protein [Trichormus sp. M33_DOE_039]
MVTGIPQSLLRGDAPNFANAALMLVAAQKGSKLHGETTAVPLSQRSRRHLLQVGKAAQRSVSPTQCLPNGLPPQDRTDSPVPSP